MRVYQRMLDALERMMMTSFQQHAQLTVDSDCLPAASTIAAEPSPAHLQAAEDSAACKDFLAHFNNFQDAIRHGDFGKTAKILDPILRLRLDITGISAGCERKRPESVHQVHEENVRTAAQCRSSQLR